jgi:hypothetical protein
VGLACDRHDERDSIYGIERAIPGVLDRRRRAGPQDASQADFHALLVIKIRTSVHM